MKCILFRNLRISILLFERLGKLSGTVSDIASCLRLNRVRFVRDEEDFNRRSLRELGRNSLMAAVRFDSVTDGAGGFANHIKYTIRMDASSVPKTHGWHSTLWDPSLDSPLLRNSQYLLGFAQLQDLIDSAIVQLQGGRPDGVVSFAQRLPTVCNSQDVFLTHIKHWLGLFGVAAWLLSVGILVTTAVTEADSGIRDVLTVSGMRNGVAPFAWALVALLIAVFQSAGIAVVLKYSGVLTLASPSLIFFISISFQFSLIAFWCPFFRNFHLSTCA